MWKVIKDHLFILLVLFFLSIIFTFPLILHLNEKLAGDGYDNYQYLLYQSIASKNIHEIKFPFIQDKTIRFPVGFDFSRGYDSVIFVLLGALLNFFVNHISAYNISLLLSFVLNGFCSYILFYQISKSRLVALIGAIMYGFSFYSLASGAGHIPKGTTAGFPLLIYSLLRLKSRQKLINFLIFVGSLLLIIFSFLQYLLILSLFLLVNLIFLIFFWKELLIYSFEIIRKNIRSLIVSNIVFIFFFSLFLLPFVWAVINGSFEDGNRIQAAINNIISLKEYIVPNIFSKTLSAKLLSAQAVPSIENVVFLGWIEIVLIGLYLFLFPSSKYKKLVVFNFLFFLILSLGIKNPDLGVSLPYSFLYHYFPFKYIPETGRFIVIFGLFATIGSVAILNTFKNKRLVLLIILLLVVAERMPVNYYLSPIHNDRFAQVVRSLPGSSVLDLPISFSEPVYDILPINYKKNIVSGYFTWSADTHLSRSFVLDHKELNRFLCSRTDPFFKNRQYRDMDIISEEERLNESLLRLLLEENIRIIVLHRDNPFKLYDFENCRNVWMRVNTLLEESVTVSPANQGMISQKWPISRVNLELFFPLSGEFQIKKAELYTTDPISLYTRLNGLPLEVTKVFGSRALPITAGTTLLIKSDKIFEKGYLKLYYSYLPNNSSEKPLNLNKKKPFLEKVYQSDQKEVYIIRE